MGIRNRLRKWFFGSQLERSRRVEALARSFFAETPGWMPKNQKCSWEELSDLVRLQYLRQAAEYLNDVENRIARFLPHVVAK